MPRRRILLRDILNITASDDVSRQTLIQILQGKSLSSCSVYMLIIIADTLRNVFSEMTEESCHKK